MSTYDQPTDPPAPDMTPEECLEVAAEERSDWLRAEARELARGFHAEDWQSWTRPQLVVYLAEAMADMAGDEPSEWPEYELDALDDVAEFLRYARAESAALADECDDDETPDPFGDIDFSIKEAKESR